MWLPFARARVINGFLVSDSGIIFINGRSPGLAPSPPRRNACTRERGRERESEDEGEKEERRGERNDGRKERKLAGGRTIASPCERSQWNEKSSSTKGNRLVNEGNAGDARKYIMRCLRERNAVDILIDGIG